MAQVTLVIKQNGEIEFAVANGEYEAAKTAIQQTIEQLRAAGIDFSELGDIERHRHDDPHTHVESGVTQHDHAH